MQHVETVRHTDYNLPAVTYPIAEASGETLPMASFAEYRELCDAGVDSFRSIGILSQEGYDAALEDASTVFCSVGGKRVAAAAPIQYEDGYDAKHCEELIGETQVMLLTVPLMYVRQGDLRRENLTGGEGLVGEFAMIIEEPASSMTSGDIALDHQLIALELSAFGNLRPKDFVDERVDKEAHRTAWMGLYGCSVGPTEETRRAVAEIDSLLDLRHLYSLKIRYDTERQLTSVEGIDSQAAKARLLEEYVQTGGTLERPLRPRAQGTNTHEVSDGVKMEIARVMDLSYDELEVRIRDKNRMASQEARSPQAGFEHAWERHGVEKQLPASPVANSEETYMYTAEQLRENQALRDKLWEISEEGFGNTLGMYHPVSMVETREGFEQVLTSHGMYLAVRYHEGEPVCFGSLTFNTEACPWLNTTSGPYARQIEAAVQAGEVPVYFFDIISNSNGGSYSSNVFQLIIKLCAQTGYTHRLLFESTNLSASYIPIMTERSIKRSAGQITSPGNRILELDKLHYWYLAPTAIE